jgi:hypothetical protein
VQPRTGVKEYTDQEQGLLSTLDLDLERQAAGGSLAQLAEEKGGGSIEVRACGRVCVRGGRWGVGSVDSLLVGRRRSVGGMWMVDFFDDGWFD